MPRQGYQQYGGDVNFGAEFGASPYGENPVPEGRRQRGLGRARTDDEERAALVQNRRARLDELRADAGDRGFGDPNSQMREGDPGIVPTEDMPAAPDEAPRKVKGSRQNWGKGEIGGVQTGADGQEYVRDGSWFVKKSVIDEYAAQGVDLLGLPTAEKDAIIAPHRMKYQQFVTQKARANSGSGFQGNGKWAQVAQAAGLGAAVTNARWTSTPTFSLVQNLAYGHTKMGVGGTFIGQRPNGWTQEDAEGNVLASGPPGTAPPIDNEAQARFEQTARDSIIQIGGSLATRLRGVQPAQPGQLATAPGTPAPQTQTARQQPIYSQQPVQQPQVTQNVAKPAAPALPTAPPSMAAPTTKPMQPVQAPQTMNFPGTTTKPKLSGIF